MSVCIALPSVQSLKPTNRCFTNAPFPVHYMGSGVKSHQDTVVHPQYVSYNSLPTSGGSLLRHTQPPSSATLYRTKRKVSAGVPVSMSATLNRPPGLVQCHKNFVSFNGNDNLLRGQSKVDPKHCNIVSNRTEEDSLPDEFPNYFPPTPIAFASATGTVSTDPRSVKRRYLQNAIAQRKLNVRKSMVEGDVSFYAGSEPVDDLIDLLPANVAHGCAKTDIEGEEHLPEYNSYNRNVLVNQRLKNGSFYKMPADFIPRSPNFSSSGHRRRNPNVNKNMNFCDQIRSPVISSDVNVQPVRTRSHAQLPVQSNSISSWRRPEGPENGRACMHGEGMTIPEDEVRVCDGDIQEKMSQMLRQKKSLRPRSYCSSNYYQFEPTSSPSPGFVHVPN